MRILVTGGAGYVGSVLVPMLVARGYDVRVVDCGMFGLEHVSPEAELIIGDVLDFDRDWLDGVDAVIHLAGLSNDPMAAYSPKLNYILNAASAAMVAQSVKESGISRFVFASTCSVYGLSDTGEVSEDHDAKPTFPYAISKLMAERSIGCLADENFRPIVFRKGTVVGWSPRMRFDLVTNTMVKTALTQNKIIVHNPSLWRPLLDVSDAARAYIRALDADLSVTGTFNIAGDSCTIGRLADVVAATLREFEIEVPLEILRRHDLRSYRVTTAKASEILDFQASVTMADTVREIMLGIRREGIDDFDHPRYHNVEQMKVNEENGVLDWASSKLRVKALTSTNGGH